MATVPTVVEGVGYCLGRAKASRALDWPSSPPGAYLHPSSPDVDAAWLYQSHYDPAVPRGSGRPDARTRRGVSPAEPVDGRARLGADSRQVEWRGAGSRLSAQGPAQREAGDRAPDRTRATHQHGYIGRRSRLEMDSRWALARSVRALVAEG